MITRVCLYLIPLFYLIRKNKLPYYLYFIVILINLHHNHHHLVMVERRIHMIRKPMFAKRPRLLNQQTCEHFDVVKHLFWSEYFRVVWYFNNHNITRNKTNCFYKIFTRENKQMEVVISQWVQVINQKTFQRMCTFVCNHSSLVDNSQSKRASLKSSMNSMNFPTFTF